MNKIIDYKEQRKAKEQDEAWKRDNGVTNYRLNLGDTIELVCSMVADCPDGCIILEAGTRGIVINARSARTVQPTVRKPRTYIYFANVCFEVEGIKCWGRVPHNAIRRVKK